MAIGPPMAGPSAPRAGSSGGQGGRRGGVVVRTMRRPRSSGPETRLRAAEASAAQEARRRKRARPSKRYRERLDGAERAGGMFYTEPEISKQFEEGVVELYDPTVVNNASTRKLSLREQKVRDGDDFALPSLSKMCLDVIADTFATHVLPLKYDQRARLQHPDNEKGKSTAMTSLRAAFVPFREPKKRSVGILGAPVADEDADDDFVPGHEEGTPSPKKATASRARGIIPKKELKHKQSMQTNNAEILDILQPALLNALHILLEHKAPQLLIPDVLSEFFLSSTKVSTTKLFRAVSVQGGISTAQIGKLLQMLYLEESSRATTRLVVSPRPNSATSLQSVHLQAFTRLTSSQLRPLFAETTSLESICLRGCISVSGDCIRQLVETSGERLRSVNLNWTSIGPNGLEAIVRGAPNIEVLKLAHVRGLSTAVVTHIMSEATEKMSLEGQIPLAKLRRLKLTGCEMGMAGVVALLEHSGTSLQSLDAGGLDYAGDSALGGIKLLAVLGLDPRANHRFAVTNQNISLMKGSVNSYNTALEKLSLAGSTMDEGPLLPLFAAIPRLRALKNINLSKIKFIPSGAPGQPFRNGMVSSLILRLFGALNLHFLGTLFFNDILDAKTDDSVLELDLDATFRTIRKRAEARTDFVFERVAFANGATVPVRVSSKGCGLVLPSLTLEHEFPLDNSRLKGIRNIDLSGTDLTGLERVEAHREANPFSRLEVLSDGRYMERSLYSENVQLIGCKLEDESTVDELAGTGRLRSLDVSQAIISQQAIDTIIEDSPFLERLDLSACRAIPVRERRNYLEIRRKPEEPVEDSPLSSPEPPSMASTLSTPSSSPRLEALDE